MMIWMNANDEIAPKKMKTAHGKLFGLTEKQLLDFGYEQREETPQAPPIEEVIPRRTFTKLEIRRTLRKLGLESRLDEVLASDPAIAKDWRRMLRGEF